MTRQLLPATSERAYLGEQAAAAKRAVIRSARELGASLKRIADVRLHARNHPWMFAGCALAAGAAAAAVLARLRSRRARRVALEARGGRAVELPPEPRRRSVVIAALQSAFAGILASGAQHAIAATVAGKAARKNGTASRVKRPKARSRGGALRHS